MKWIERCVWLAFGAALASGIWLINENIRRQSAKPGADFPVAWLEAFQIDDADRADFLLLERWAKTERVSKFEIWADREGYKLNQKEIDAITSK